MKYKINIHAHSIFSDGTSSPVIMAMKAKELGFSALVLTEHHYLVGDKSRSLTIEKVPVYKRAIVEAKKVLPVITGLEIPFLDQEILIFGGEAVKMILENQIDIGPQGITWLRENTHCATVLCHPSDGYEHCLDYVDGVEKYNGRQGKHYEGELLDRKQHWFNSDAHHVNELGKAYNVVKSKITIESDLVKYIKKGRSTSFEWAVY